MFRTLLLLALTLSFAHAQDTAAKKQPVTPEAGTVKPLPKGEVKVLKAIVMEVKGVAQARADRKAKWKKLKKNDVLEPGTIIRTGRKSYVALRIGSNASVLVERQSRVALPEMVQDGAVLRTRVSMSLGRAQVRVDRVGLDNDFEVETPTATLAVRGTTLLITWSAVQGFRAIGIIGNFLRSIEVRYISGFAAELGGADGTSQLHPLPALTGFFTTYLRPLEGSIGKSEKPGPTQGDPDRSTDPRLQSSSIKAAQKSRGNEKTSIGNSPGDTNDNPR